MYNRDLYTSSIIVTLCYNDYAGTVVITLIVMLTLSLQQITQAQIMATNLSPLKRQLGQMTPHQTINPVSSFSLMTLQPPPSNLH